MTTKDAFLLTTYPDCDFVIYHGEWHDQGVTTLLIWGWRTDDERTIRMFNSLDEGQRFASRLNADKAKLHLPTSAPCHVMRTSFDRSFCDFYSRANPFTWVMTSELA
jgi:hypothetical protein